MGESGIHRFLCTEPKVIRRVDSFLLRREVQMSIKDYFRTLIIQIKTVASRPDRARIGALESRMTAMEHERGRWGYHPMSRTQVGCCCGRCHTTNVVNPQIGRVFPQEVMQKDTLGGVAAFTLQEQVHNAVPLGQRTDQLVHEPLRRYAV